MLYLIPPSLSSAGTSCGGVVYPILLNKLINGRVGFAWGVRASAFLTLGLLVVANLTLSTRTSSIRSSAPATKLSRTQLLRDYPYWISLAGYVELIAVSCFSCRLMNYSGSEQGGLDTTRFVHPLSVCPTKYAVVRYRDHPQISTSNSS